MYGGRREPRPIVKLIKDKYSYFIKKFTIIFSGYFNGLNDAPTVSCLRVKEEAEDWEVCFSENLKLD